MKRILRLDRLRLRGLSGARDEVLLTATAQTCEGSSSYSAVLCRHSSSPLLSVASRQTCWATRLNSRGAQWQAEITAERPRANSMNFATQSPQQPTSERTSACVAMGQTGSRRCRSLPTLLSERISPAMHRSRLDSDHPKSVPH